MLVPITNQRSEIIGHFSSAFFIIKPILRMCYLDFFPLFLISATLRHTQHCAARNIARRAARNTAPRNTAPRNTVHDRRLTAKRFWVWSFQLPWGLRVFPLNAAVSSHTPKTTQISSSGLSKMLLRCECEYECLFVSVSAIDRRPAQGLPRLPLSRYPDE